MSYVPDMSGRYTITIKYGGDEIPYSPFRIHALPTGDASKCLVTGRHLPCAPPCSAYRLPLECFQTPPGLTPRAAPTPLPRLPIPRPSPTPSAHVLLYFQCPLEATAWVSPFLLLLGAEVLRGSRELGTGPELGTGTHKP